MASRTHRDGSVAVTGDGKTNELLPALPWARRLSSAGFLLIREPLPLRSGCAVASGPFAFLTRAVLANVNSCPVRSLCGKYDVIPPCDPDAFHHIRYPLPSIPLLAAGRAIGLVMLARSVRITTSMAAGLLLVLGAEGLQPGCGLPASGCTTTFGTSTRSNVP